MFDEDEGSSVLVKVGLAGAAVALTALIVNGVFLTFIAWSLGSFLDLARYATVSTWPVHRGYVQEWGFKPRGNGVVMAWAEYLYEVDGEVYHAWRPRLTLGEYPNEQSARQALSAFPVGKQVHVAVNPFDSTDAVLDPSGQDWLTLGLRIAVACLVLVAVGYLLGLMGVPDYAIALALCALIAAGGAVRAKSDKLAAQREGISPAQLWERQAKVAKLRADWASLEPGMLVSQVASIGEPDARIPSPEGPQTWIFDKDTGMESAGKIEVSPSTRGWVVVRAYPPYTTQP
jgi:hypothetical protein